MQNTMLLVEGGKKQSKKSRILHKKAGQNAIKTQNSGNWKPARLCSFGDKKSSVGGEGGKWSKYNKDNIYPWICI